MKSRKDFRDNTLFFVENTLFLRKILCFEKKYSDFILQFRLPMIIWWIVRWEFSKKWKDKISKKQISEDCFIDNCQELFTKKKLHEQLKKKLVLRQKFRELFAFWQKSKAPKKRNLKKTKKITRSETKYSLYRKFNQASRDFFSISKQKSFISHECSPYSQGKSFQRSLRINEEGTSQFDRFQILKKSYKEFSLCVERRVLRIWEFNFIEKRSECNQKASFLQTIRNQISSFEISSFNST